MITKEEAKGAAAPQAKKTKRGQVNYLKGADEKFEFKKTSRFDTKEQGVEGFWDPVGRFYAIVGITKQKSDKSEKSVRFFNVLGELINKVDKLKSIQQFSWRPKPKFLLSEAEL